MRLTFALSLCALLLVSPVLAKPSTGSSAGATDSCGWSAGLEDDEGGQVMVASSCETDTEFGPVLRLLCGEGINIRYNAVGIDPNQTELSTLVLTSGETSISADVIYEEMDGAFAAYVEMSSPIIALLKTGDEVGVTFEGANVPPTMVSLQGSSAAIDELVSACQ